MELKENFNLKEHNTFGISVFAKFFTFLKSEQDLIELLHNSIFKENKYMFLGGGSNVLFTKDYEGIVIKNELKGIEIIEEKPEFVLLRAMGGEVWHDLVLFSVEHNFWGIENLAFVPGTVGAAPIQNIGAYGIELCDTLYEIEAYELSTGEKKVFKNNECSFGYRDSIFKKEAKDKYFISAIILKLSKVPRVNIEYKALKEYLIQNNLEVKTSKDVANAVEAVRRSKLPDWRVLGNAGSFFKNTIVPQEKVSELLKTYPQMPHYKEDITSPLAPLLEGEGEKIQYKIPTAWLIEECGFKGQIFGFAGVHDKQALVLVNHGEATGQDILNLAEKIISAVHKKFGITITPEVNFV